LAPERSPLTVEELEPTPKKTSATLEEQTEKELLRLRAREAAKKKLAEEKQAALKAETKPEPKSTVPIPKPQSKLHKVGNFLQGKKPSKWKPEEEAEINKRAEEIRNENRIKEYEEEAKRRAAPQPARRPAGLPHIRSQTIEQLRPKPRLAPAQQTSFGNWNSIQSPSVFARGFAPHPRSPETPKKKQQPQRDRPPFW
jgi:hypothetical protein